MEASAPHSMRTANGSVPSPSSHFPLASIETEKRLILPLAVLIAFLQARRAAMAGSTVVTTVPQVRSASSDTVCCDNFA